MTSAQLNALPYGKAAFGQGMIAEDYRKQFREPGVGERIRHWSAFPKAQSGAVGPNGETPERDGALYIETALPSDARFLVTGVRAEVSDNDFGAISQGTCDFACLPDELEVARPDRIVLIDRPRFARQGFAPSGALSPSGAARDELAWNYVTELVRVTGDGVAVTGATLEVENDGTSFVVWPATPPALCRIELRYAPQYVFLGTGDRVPPRGADGLFLPQRIELTQENRKTNHASF